MAHKRFLKHAFAFLRLALVISLLFSACSNPTGPDLATETLSAKYTTVKDSKTYELTVTQSAVNAKPRPEPPILQRRVIPTFWKSPKRVLFKYPAER